MLVDDIKKLPKEFDFKSRINPFGITYHAKEEKHSYMVTWNVDTENISQTTYSKKDFRRHLLKDEFVVCR